MRKLINQPADVVKEMLEGFLVLYPGLSRLSHCNVIVRSDAEESRQRQIAIISGGGSGHEPAHAGYVGAGMLSAAVAGEVFTSPSADSVLSAIRAVVGEPGVLLIVKNYTGDRLNFGVAAEMARSEGARVETVVVADDVALPATEKFAGRRGIAGTVLVHKIAGAAAAEGRDLAELASIARAAAENLGTMGVALSAGTSPELGKPSFTLEGEVELGLGIHGEPGVRRLPLLPADKLVDEILNTVVTALQLRSGERIAVLINNLGSTTTMELAIVGRRTLSTLQSHGLVIERLYAGTFLSSLDMAGVSISLLRVNDERLRWLDAPTAAPAWPRTLPERPRPLLDRTLSTANITARPIVPVQTAFGKKMQVVITAAVTELLHGEGRLTELDRMVGDGDLGLNVARGAKAVQDALPTYPLDNAAETLKGLGLTLQQKLGGSSGPLYGVLLLTAGAYLQQCPMNDAKSWAKALIEGCKAVGDLGGAKLGDRTMLDALIPFARKFHDELIAGSSAEAALVTGAAAAEEGAQKTALMTARRGRSSYLGNRVLGWPDPGAVAVSVWARAIASAIATS